MTNIILPSEETSEQDPEKEEYNATEEDEERFFLMYHMNLQPSEAEGLSPSYRKWLIMRFVAQKNMEKEAVERQRLMSHIGQNLKA